LALGIGLPQVARNSVLGRGAEASPANRILAGCIGTGPQGQGVMRSFLAQPDVRIVAICDVKDEQQQQARDAVNKRNGDVGCAVCRDFRELLARPDIEVVLVATPDHWHVPIAIAAARAGKDMYLEKPMGLSIAEDQKLRTAIQEHRRVFQFGTQQRSSDQFRLACELVRNGRIGALREINVWCAASQPGGSDRPIPAPPGIDYDLWLGPAPYTPYTEGKCAANNKTWWFNYDYALGFVAGWGVHPLDIALWATDAFRQGTLEVEGRAVIPTQGACNTAVAWEVVFRCANGVKMTYKGNRNGFTESLPMNDLSAWASRYGRIVDHGTAFEGSEGWILVDRSGIRTRPERLIEEKFGSDDVRLARSSNHVRNLLDNVRSRGRTICPVEEAFEADLLCHLSDIATRLERPLKWDPIRESFVDDAEANRRLGLRPMRPPWQV